MLSFKTEGILSARVLQVAVVEHSEKGRGQPGGQAGCPWGIHVG
jgi:hypothetical protein